MIFPPNQLCDRTRVAVVGTAGRLGSSLVKALEQRHSVVSLTRNDFDLACLDSISAALEPLKYDLLVLTAALTAVDYCEIHEEEAFAVNADAAGLIAEISARKGAHVTFLSTDMVFNGAKAGPYSEDDSPDPVSVYGASKLKGEELVLNASNANLVVRVSWLYGPGKPAFPEWILEKACSEKNLTLPIDKICCPTYSLDLVEYITALLFGEDVRASGVFHLCNSEPCSWRDWGQFCIDAAREAGLPILTDTIEGVPVDSVAAFVAKRPVNSSMSSEKFSKLTGIRPRNWRDALEEFLPTSAPFCKHSQLVTVE